MKTRPFLSSLLVAALAVPPQAFAQGPAAPVQPVPYAPSQPVPYPGAASPGDAAVDVPRAAPIGNDVVYLKGGGLLRGTLIEAIPNDHATLELATGQTAVVPWDRIQRIDRGGASGAPSVPPPSSETPTPAPAPGGTAVVHIEADSPVVLERREGRAWVFTCNSPCDAEVPLAGPYRMRGSGVRNSGQFQLSAQPGDHVVLDVSTASTGGFVGGIVSTSVGGFAMLAGALVLMTVATVDAADSASGFPNPSGDGTANMVGWVLVAGGATAVVVGIVLLTSNSHSKVEQAPATQRPRNDAWLRVPQWHEDKAASGLPKVVGVPLFQTKF